MIFTAAERDTGPAISLRRGDKTKRAIRHRRRSQQQRGATAFLPTAPCAVGVRCLYFHCSLSDLRYVVPRGDIFSHPEGLSRRSDMAANRNERKAIE